MVAMLTIDRGCALRGNPLAGVTELERVRFVMKGSAVIKETAKK
jgi:hypothetical protein